MADQPSHKPPTNQSLPRLIGSLLGKFLSISDQHQGKKTGTLQRKKNPKAARRGKKGKAVKARRKGSKDRCKLMKVRRSRRQNARSGKK